MAMPQILVQLLVLAGFAGQIQKEAGPTPEKHFGGFPVRRNVSQPEKPPADSADAMLPEHLQAAINRLNDPSFAEREKAVDQLFSLGLCAVYPLKLAVENGPPEVAVRAFDVLQRIYRLDDEQTFEAVEQVFRELKHVDNLAVSAKAERAFDSITEVRQNRAVAKLEQLGAMIHYSDPSQDRQPFSRPRIDHVMFGRDWIGKEQDFLLIGRIEDLRTSDRATIYVIRGVQIPDAIMLDLRGELPSLEIQERGPARLGVSSSRDIGCVIGKIEPGSSADLAGLRMFDQVLEIDGQKVENFENLVNVVGQKEPGDRIPIVFRRNGEIHEVVAELTGWTRNPGAKAPPPKNLPATTLPPNAPPADTSPPKVPPVRPGQAKAPAGNE